MENINSQVPHNGLFITLVTKTQITVHKLPQTYHRHMLRSHQYKQVYTAQGSWYKTAVVYLITIQIQITWQRAEMAVISAHTT